MSATRMFGTTAAIGALVLMLAAGAAAQNRSRPAAAAAAPSPSLSGPAGGVLGSIDVVTAEQIAATAATDIRAALALVPTLIINDTGGPSGQVTLSLRGSGSRQVLVLVDGHRVSGASSAPFNLSDLAVPIERIVRIEVIPSPVSVIYGPDALGGVVNIVTRPAGVTPEFAISYGRGAEAGQRIAGGAQFGVKKLGLRLDGQWLGGDGYRDNGDYDLKNFVAGAFVAPAPWGFDVRWTSLDRETGSPGPAAHPSPQARRTDTSDGLRADIVYLPGGGWDLKAGVFTGSRSLRFTDPAPPVVDPRVRSVPIADTSEYSSNGIELQLDFDTKNGEFYSVGGAWVDDTFKGGDKDRTAEHWSVYTQDQWRSGGWSAVGAIRRDQHSAYGGRTNPSLSVGWGSDGWNLWAAWARSFRTPGFDELYLNQQFLKGNPDLKPETSESYDGGIEMGGGDGRVRLSYFRRSVENMIVWSDAGGDFVSRAGNVPQATISGWEAQVLYRPSASIAIPVGYQQLSTEDDATRARIPGTVHSLWRAAIQGTGAKLTWSLEYAITDRGEYRQRAGAWSDTVVNAAIAWRDTIGSVPVQASLRLDNLQDRTYETVEGYPMPGRSWFAELKVGL